MEIDNTNKFFVVSYTCKEKKYCDSQFFDFLNNITYKDIEINVVDNSPDLEYIQRLMVMAHGTRIHLHKIDVDDTNRFHASVAKSANYLRDLFLKSDYPYFVIVESDVIPPPNFLETMLEVVDQVDAVGGIYYPGPHPEEWFSSSHSELIEVPHVLSGCTLYKRRLIELINFRYDPNYLGPFPDAWICYDALNKFPEYGFKFGNYTKIKCKHIK